MKPLKISTSLLTIVTLFTSVTAPIYAGMPNFEAVNAIDTCKDINIGNDSRIVKTVSDDSSKTHDIQDVKDTSDVKDTADSSYKNTEKTSGGGSFLGIGANGSHEESHEGSLKTDRSHKDDNSVKTDSSSERARKEINEQTTSTVRQGKDCDRVIESVSKVDMNKEDNATARHIADQKAEVERQKARTEMMKDLLKW
ncbi:hypothetical protein NIES4101_62870 [Calothrix sp. NIES-4101]|nr:hypothetical protein NIES4101_62870 [Calothrix sp. NIES-4101]